MTDCPAPVEADKELERLLAEYKIGFVVGDKNVDEHFKNYKAALLAWKDKACGAAVKAERAEWHQVIYRMEHDERTAPIKDGAKDE